MMSDAMLSVCPATWQIARHAEARGLPFVYRGQAVAGASGAGLGGVGGGIGEIPMSIGEQAVASWLALRRVAEHTSSASPADHHSLGLSHYAQCTAPARRYADLTLLQQVSAELCGGRLPYEDSKSLLRQHEAVRGRIKQTHVLQRASENFWVLRYLQEACWRAGPALSVRAVLLAPYASSLARGEQNAELSAEPASGPGSDVELHTAYLPDLGTVRKLGVPKGLGLVAGEEVPMRVTELSPHKNMLVMHPLS